MKTRKKTTDAKPRDKLVGMVKLLKPAMVLSLAFGILAWPASAEEMRLSLKQVTAMDFSCSVTNQTTNQLYIVPVYVVEQFYVKPNCPDCAPSWIARTPMSINDATNAIPVAPGRSLNFSVVGSPNLPWRVSCVALTKPIPIDGKITPDGKDQFLIRSAEIPATVISSH